jgi:cell division protein FtsW (lipid II flippase)
MIGRMNVRLESVRGYVRLRPEPRPRPTSTRQLLMRALAIGIAVGVGLVLATQPNPATTMVFGVAVLAYALVSITSERPPRRRR